jgi:hypothetical protein
MSCVVPKNQPIYQALIDKAASYPPDKPNLSEVYKKAANSVATYNRNIYQDYAKYDGLYYALPFVGGQIEDSISDVVKKNPQTTVPQTVKTCVVPQNQPIYLAILNEAASYTGNMIYLSRVWNAVADALANYNRNLYDGNYFHANELPVIGYTIGSNVENFINEFIRNNPQTVPQTGPQTVSQTVPETVLQPLTCVVPLNQPLYQALLDKAASYPADKPYQARAYKKVAEAVAMYPSLITLDTGYDLPCPPFGSVDKFVYEFIKNNPNTQQPQEPLEMPPQTQPQPQPLEPVQEPLYTAENPRRSTRIANKPKKNYYSENDEIAEAIQDVCYEYGCEYSDELVEEFKQWRKTASIYFTKKYDCETRTYIPKKINILVKSWSSAFSTSLRHQQNIIRLYKELVKRCAKKGITCDASLTRKFINWVEDPANKNIIAYTTSGNDALNNLPYVFYYSPNRTISKWFTSLKKQSIV